MPVAAARQCCVTRRFCWQCAPHNTFLKKRTTKTTSIATTRNNMQYKNILFFCVLSALCSCCTPWSTAFDTSYTLWSILSSIVPYSTTRTERSYIICASSFIVSRILRISSSRSSARLEASSSRYSCAYVKLTSEYF